MIFAGGVVNPPVSFADSPLYTRGPLSSLNNNLPHCHINDASIFLFTERNTAMEEKFIAAWMQNREKAAAFGARMRPVDPATAMKTAHFVLGGSRLSDGFDALAKAGHLELSLEALAVDRRFTQLFSDEEANNALSRLLDAGYRF